MRIIQPCIAIALASTLAACGGSGPSPSSSVAASKAAAASLPANASAEQVASHMRGNVHCPADAPAAPAGTPVDDIVGVRPGLTYEQAANAVMCSSPLLVVTPVTNRGYDIQTYGQTIRQGFNALLAEPRVEKTAQQTMHEMQQEFMDRENNATRHLQPGQSRWFVSTMGPPGKERVVSAAREEWFAKGKNPTMASVIQALTKKYGTPSANQDMGSGDRALSWAYDPQGRPVVGSSCSGIWSPDQGANLSPDCGVTIVAQVVSMRDNPALGRFVDIGVVDGAAGYKLLTDTENGLKAMDAARRAAQVKEAAKNAGATQF
jgi:hypothetical protein